jgi:hypothetical protein
MIAMPLEQLGALPPTKKDGELILRSSTPATLARWNLHQSETDSEPTRLVLSPSRSPNIAKDARQFDLAIEVWRGVDAAAQVGQRRSDDALDAMPERESDRTRGTRESTRSLASSIDAAFGAFKL